MTVTWKKLAYASDVIPLTQKAAASGVASLDASSKVVQDPATSYIPSAQKAAASGVASLDAGSLVVQKPAGRLSKANFEITLNKLLRGAGAGADPTEIIPGTLTATCVVIANDAKAAVKTWATILQAAGYPVWVCDGVADNVEIQAAIAALTAGRTVKETVKLIGSFTIAAKITLSSYTILDLTDAKITLANNVNDDLFYISNKTQIDIIGGILNGNKANQTAGSAIRNITATSTFITIKNVTINDFFFRGLRIDDATDILIQGCVIGGSGERDISTSRCNRVTIDNNRLTANSALQAIIFNAASATGNYTDLRITDNIIKEAYTNSISITGIAGSTLKNVNISDNILLNAGLSPIWIDGIVAVSQLIISGNIIIEGGLAARGSALDGILAGYIQFFTISNNVIHRPCAGGITVVRSKNGQVVGNAISEAGYPIGTAARGIVLNRCDYLTVIGNTVTATQDHGIWLGGCTYCTISANTVKDSSLRANNAFPDIDLVVISGVNSTNNIISANVLRATQDNKVKYNIWEEDANQDYNRIEGNLVAGAVTAPIRKQGANSIVKNNTGYITENSGTATIPDTATSIVVDHGLATTPTRVIISLTNNPTNDPQVWWVDTLTATQFTIHTKVDPGATGAIFNWRAQVGEG